MKIEDGEILQLISLKGSREKGFRLLVEKYQQKLYWHIRRIVTSHDGADDVLQNTFIKIWKGLKNFREEAQLFTWMYRIATNEALSHIKKNKRYVLSSDNNDSMVQEQPQNDPLYSSDEISARLHRAVLSLPHKQQLVFNMKYFDEMKYEEISAILGTSVGALKASYHLAVKKIENSVVQD